MRELLWATFISSAASYLVACLLFLAQARRRTTAPVAGHWGTGLLLLGAALHLTYVLLYSVVDQRCPVYSLHSALGIVSIVGVIGYAMLSRGRRLEALGSFVAASATAFLIIAHTIGPSSPVPNQRSLMALHITSNLLGGGLLLVAGCASAFYLVNEKRLKSRRGLGQRSKLPPLEALDSVVHRLLWIGVPLLTVGMLTGRMVIHQTAVITSGDRFRAILSGLSWLLLLVVLVLRQVASWRGRRSAYATLSGAVGIFVVIALYVVRALWGEGL